MDTGFAQVVSAALGAIASIVVAIVAGYFNVKAAEAKIAEKNQNIQKQGVNKPTISRSKFVLYGFIVGILAMLLGFVIAYTGKSLNGGDFTSTFTIVSDSLDPALVSGILGFAGFLLGVWAGNIGLGAGRYFLMFLIVSIFSAPVAYSLGYTGNWLSGTPDTLLFANSFDSMVVGALFCAISFLLG